MPDEVEFMWWHPQDGSGRMELVEFHGMTGMVNGNTHVEVARVRTALPGQPLFNVPYDELSLYEPMPEHDVDSIEDWLDA